jgi:aryl-alcohol dehydrogenase-like predicted oxidoreductase
MTMRRRRLPGTGLSLSVIALGTVPMGGAISEDDTFRLLDAYVELGGNFIDTAEIYSNWLEGVEHSLAERRIGKWLAARGLKDEVVVATKGGHPRIDAPDHPRLSADDLMDDIDGSRERLGLETLPLYYLHRDDPARSVEEIVDALGAAIDAEKIRFIGCSNWTVPRIREAQAYAEKNDRPTFVISQVRWSLAKVNPESQKDAGLVEMDDTMRHYHRETGLAAAAYSSQAQGFFSGAYGRNVNNPATPNGEKIKSYYYSPRNFDALERVSRLAREVGRPPTQVALAYLLSQPFPTFPVIGTTSVEHLKESCGAYDLQLSKEQVRRLVAGL